MSLPMLVRYELPTRESVVPSRAHWQPEPDCAVLLMHDVQRYFLRSYDQEAEPMLSTLAHMARLAEACRTAGVPVVYSAQPGEQKRVERGLLWDLWGPGIATAPELEGFYPQLAPQGSDIILYKRRYSAFFETELERILRSSGRSELWIAGVYGHIGCLATANDAFMRGIRPFLIADGIADFSQEDHAFALRQVARTCGVIAWTDELLATLPIVAPGSSPSLRASGLYAER